MNKGRIALAASLLTLISPGAWGAPGDSVSTPTVPQELPIEVETELGPASLKQAPLWKELIQLLENPYGTVTRRPGFGVSMPPLNMWGLDYNFLTSQPLRLRTNDGEVSWDQPGPLFDPDEEVPVDAFNVPIALRTVIGELVVDENNNLVVRNPEAGDPGSPDPRLPPDGTIIAVPAVVGGVLHELDPLTGDLEPVVELEAPINEEDFLAGETREEKNIARAAAEVLGKALFWDMQVGSDGVQACGSCHFHAGVDNRTRNQLNPNHLGGDLSLQVKGPNQSVVGSDFPFHKLANPDIPGEPLLNPGNVVKDSNDVMSSMGVRFRRFTDIPTPGPLAFGPASNGIKALLPDLGSAVADPIPVFQGLRRVEPRNTPTMHSAAFNFDNFWDGRARFNFNGGSVFGPSDPTAHIFIDEGAGLEGATNGDFRPDLEEEDPEMAEQPVRIKFSSLASQAVGPPLSEFEMSFEGRNWPKIGKKLLQAGVTPLAKQLVATNDSVLGPWSNQGGANCPAGTTALNKPGLCITYSALIRQAFRPDLWSNTTQHLNGAQDLTDPFDTYSLTIAAGASAANNTNQFNQMEANFSTFFALAVQMYEELLIPDDSPFDQFMDANPLAANGIGEPGSQNVLHPTLVRDLVGGGVTLVPGFGEDELYGFDIFAGGNLTAALPNGSARNPAGFGSNPFSRTARCMLCHLGPEQTDHSINIAHGLLKGDAEFEFPTPPEVPDPNNPGAFLPAPEPTGPIRVVPGLILAEEIEESAQDAVEVEPRSFSLVDDPATDWDDRIVAQPKFFAFGDQGIYNIGLRPVADDSGRGGTDPFGWPLSLSALAMKNVGGTGFEPGTPMANFDPFNIDLTFEETGGGLSFPGTSHTLQSINPGFERGPISPQLPSHMSHWTNNLPAGELHPQIDELAFSPNVTTVPNGGPAVEFTEYIFGIDIHCGTYNPAVFGAGPPNFGWGATDPVTGQLVPGKCPQNQSGVASNIDYPLHGTWPFVNRVLKDGTFKAPSLRNVELTGPYFHTGSYLTLRQVVDFYIRGGDFPMTNAEHRDPHIVNVGEQAFGFGTTIPTPENGLEAFADALPDPQYRYAKMPDTAHPGTPEPASSTPEQAKGALVKFLISMTDARVKFEKAPFDRPEIFVPVDGSAPDNPGGRSSLLTDARFRRVPPVGAAGRPTPLPNFLNVSSTPVTGPNNDHFDR